MPITRVTTPIIFDVDTPGDPPVQGLTLFFETIERVPPAVPPFEVSAPQCEEVGRVPAHTPEWTDLKASDPGSTWVADFFL